MFSLETCLLTLLETQKIRKVKLDKDDGHFGISDSLLYIISMHHVCICFLLMVVAVNMFTGPQP